MFPTYRPIGHIAESERGNILIQALVFILHILLPLKVDSFFYLRILDDNPRKRGD
jgi:hypothetical protein